MRYINVIKTFQSETNKVLCNIFHLYTIYIYILYFDMAI